MVLACAARGIVDLAITDHVDEHGQFMFLPTFRARHPLAVYLDEIRDLRGMAARAGVRLHAGVELMACTGNPGAPVGGELVAAFPALSVIHVDGVQVARVAVRALEVARQARRVVDPPPVVCISHPDFPSLSGDDVESLIAGGVRLELNNAKFSPRDAGGVRAMLDLARDNGWGAPGFLLGSDAHSSPAAGDVSIVASFAREMGLRVAPVGPPLAG